LVAALRRASDRGARLLSICSGAFLLAAAGLLDGKRATTHWLYADDFKRLFPGVVFEDDVLYVDEGQIITSAGSAAGIDACLHLVRRDFGASVANTVARRMVIPPHREGGQAQYVEAPVALRPGRTISGALDYARQRLDRPIEIRELVARAAMSERTFLRRFKDSVGMTPNTWLQRERMARARDLLETTAMTHADIAGQCGYDSPETFRVAFRRIVGVSPGAYRARFAQRAGPQAPPRADAGLAGLRPAGGSTRTSAR
jgi:AraC family transcriptional activator FtrA